MYGTIMEGIPDGLDKSRLSTISSGVSTEFSVTVRHTVDRSIVLQITCNPVVLFLAKAEQHE